MLELLVAVGRLSTHKDPARDFGSKRSNCRIWLLERQPRRCVKAESPRCLLLPRAPVSELKAGKGPNFCNEQEAKWTKAEVGMSWGNIWLEMGFVSHTYIALPQFPKSFHRQLIANLPGFQPGCPPACLGPYEACNYCFTPFSPVVEQSLLQAPASLKIHLLCSALKHIE